MKIKNFFGNDEVNKSSKFNFTKSMYMALFFCIGIAIATVMFVTIYNMSSLRGLHSSNKDDFQNEKYLYEDEKEDSSSVINHTEQEKNSMKKAEIASSTSLKSPKPDKKEADKKTTNKEVAPSDKKKTSEKQNEGSAKQQVQKFIMPVFGEITFDFSKDKLIFSKTLNEWRTHNGLDIAANRGTPVKAVADGVVIDIKNDYSFGITVIIEHSDGVKAVYSNLASGDMVLPNQKISQGNVIGSVGNTASFESLERPHLHFEVMKNNEYVDPKGYLPKKG